MKTYKGLLLAGIVMFGSEAFAQSFAETALMFSRTRAAGSARIQALGGAQTALGGDFSSALSNPAGLGMYNRSEFSFTPGFYTTNTKGDYFAGDNLISQSNNDNRSGITLPGLSLVFSSDQNAKDRFIRGTFAVTLQRVNDFNRNIRYEGQNPSTSLIDYFIEDATGRNPNQFEEGGALFNTITELAYNNYLIGPASLLDPNNSDDAYFTDILSQAYQTETFETKGAQNKWSFSYGANFDDRFFLGAGLGVTSLRYSTQKTYTESFSNEPLESFKLDEQLEIRGSAIDLTVGGIARPVDIIQVGVSVATPTYFNLTDVYTATMRSSWENFDYYGDGSEILGNEKASTDDAITSEYNLSTPWRLNFGTTVFVSKHGFITADIERVNYSKARYSSQISGIEFGSDNDRIKALYKSVTNIRLGGEVRVEKLRFRGGYQFMPDPFTSPQNGISRSFQAISGGLGYKTADFFVDLAVVQSLGKNSYRPYRVNTEESPILNFNQNSTNVLVTVGFNF